MIAVIFRQRIRTDMPSSLGEDSAPRPPYSHGCASTNSVIAPYPVIAPDLSSLANVIFGRLRLDNVIFRRLYKVIVVGSTKIESHNRNAEHSFVVDGTSHCPKQRRSIKQKIIEYSIAVDML